MVRKIATFAVFVAGAFISLLAQETSRTIVPLAKAKRGCTFVVGTNLNVLYERTIVVAKKEVAAGAPEELWVVFPDRDMPVDRDGHVAAVNIAAASVLFLSRHDGPVIANQRGQRCRCPIALWAGVR